MPSGEVLTVPEALNHPQVRERQLVLDLGIIDGVDRPVKVVRSGFRLASGDPYPSSPPPCLGADTADVLAEIGYDQRRIAELINQGVIKSNTA